MVNVPPPAKVSNPGKIPKRRWLLVAEDSKSSLLYFKGFQIDPNLLEVHSVGGAGDPQSVVEHAITLREDAVRKRHPYAEVWAIFDRDDWPLNRFQEALHRARKEGIRPIWSNEAFELWYILHFTPRVTPMARAEFKQWLDRNNSLSRPYDKSDPNIYGALKQHQRNALMNADRLLNEYETSSKMEERIFPERQNPSTNVQRLVRELNEFLRPSLPSAS